MDSLLKGFAAGGLDGGQSVIRNTTQDLHHLAIAIIATLQLAPDCGHCWWQDPILERGSVAQGTGFARQNRHIVPGVIDCLGPAEASRVFTDDHTVLANDDPLGIGMDLDGSTDRRRDHRVFVVVEPHRACL